MVPENLNESNAAGRRVSRNGRYKRWNLAYNARAVALFALHTAEGLRNVNGGTDYRRLPYVRADVARLRAKARALAPVPTSPEPPRPLRARARARSSQRVRVASRPSSAAGSGADGPSPRPRAGEPRTSGVRS